LNRITGSILLPAATALLLACGLPESIAQEGMQAPAKDTIFARKILMGAIDMNMDEVETALSEGAKPNFSDLREHADTISIMLMAFPHMFPASTNQWKPGADRDPATDTYASPDLWTDFGAFYEKAGAASKIAYSASRAENASEFRQLISQLRYAGNSCHEAFQKKD
jgi:hypothetical protein